MRIGIFGGTFNPPHLGHLLLAQAAAEGAGLDRVIFMPCKIPPHKTVLGLTDAEMRFEMVRLSIMDNPMLEISDMELKAEGISYTAWTVKRLKEMYPSDEICFIVGADSLCDMEKWYAPDEIFKYAEIVAALRGGRDDRSIEKAAEAYRKKYNAKITIVSMPLIEMASSDIRERIRLGMDVRYMLTDKTRRFIEKNGIYRE